MTRERNAALRRKLHAWYSRNRRDLPWRRTKDPYAIWVSEILCQQTRVAAAQPYYERFLKRFPDVHALARARVSTVLAHWSGLGYYRRARHLHAASRVVARDGFPDSAAAWRRLPGVGAYTAAAIASIAYGERAAVVDGNVERVLSRVHGITRDPARVRALAQEWVPARAPGDHNQAMMELGALVCTPRAPSCARCPLRSGCAGRETPERYPAPRARSKPQVERVSVAYALRGSRVLLRLREGGGLMEGLWELPPADGGAPLAVVKHSVLDRRIEITVRDGPPLGEGRWFTPARAAALPLTGAARKCLSRVGFFAMTGA